MNPQVETLKLTALKTWVSFLVITGGVLLLSITWNSKKR